MRQTVICVDFDGTLVNEQGRIHPADVEILRHERRVIFVPATGRALSSVRRTFRNEGLFLAEPTSLPLVLQNGAALYGPGEKLLIHHPVAPELQAALLAIARAHADVTTYLEGVDGLCAIWRNPFAMQMEQRYNLEVLPFDETRLNRFQFSKLTVISDRPEALRSLAADLADLPVRPAFTLPEVVDVNQVGVDKGMGALQLLAALGLENARVVAAGDGENDLALFARAEIAVAPAGSPRVVRERATHIVDAGRKGILAPILDLL